MDKTLFHRQEGRPSCPRHFVGDCSLRARSRDTRVTSSSDTGARRVSKKGFTEMCVTNG